MGRCRGSHDLLRMDLVRIVILSLPDLLSMDLLRIVFVPNWTCSELICSESLLYQTGLAQN
jgi:hypothetical protein